MKPVTILRLAFLLAALAAGGVQAQVPSILNYQGRVTVGGTNLTTNAAQFKFALVDSNGTTVYWKNDGTTMTDEPTNAVSVAVSQGLYSTLLGDTALANMAALPSSVFTNADVNLRVWFSAGGTNPFVQLSPDQRLGAAGYALRAAVADTASVTNVPGDLSVGGVLSVAQLVGGSGSSASGPFSVVSGGAGNTASGEQAVVGGGGNNVASGTNSTIAGGTDHNASGDFTSIGGGFRNFATNRAATVSGGDNNGAYGAWSAIGGGQQNTATASGDFATIGGGTLNTVSARSTTVAGGESNTNTADYATVGGGTLNTVSGFRSVIGGGNNNMASGTNAVVTGGDNNTAVQSGGAVVGGFTNTAGGFASFVGGGSLNEALGDYATIGGGISNTIDSVATNSVIAGGQGNAVGLDTLNAFIGGGSFNFIESGSDVTIAGGSFNKARGFGATVAGGAYNDAFGDDTFAAGVQAKATNIGSFVWSGTYETDTTSTNDYSFTVRAPGGVRFITTLATNNLDIGGTVTNGVALAAGSGSWTTLSDFNAKENFAPVDPVAVLAKVTSMPVMSWNYKTQAADIRHLGPTAQDFKRAFGVGESDTGISSVDADGVAFAAIQGLAQELKERDKAIEELKSKLKAVEERLNSLPPAP